MPQLLKQARGTAAAYAALSVKDPDTLYYIKDAAGNYEHVYLGSDLLYSDAFVGGQLVGNVLQLTKADGTKVNITFGDIISRNASDFATAAQGTKADNAMPKSGGTFTGAITLAGDPVGALSPASKQWVEAQIVTAVGSVDAMSFKGTLGTGGTVTALPTTGVKIGHTYKVITAGSYASTQAKVGDLFIASAATPVWLHIPSGDENETILSITSGTPTISTTKQTGDVTLGEAAAKQVATTINATGNKLPTEKAVADYVTANSVDNLIVTAPIIKTGNTVGLADASVTPGSYGEAANKTVAFGGTLKVTQTTVDKFGRVTGILERTITLPSSEATTAAKGLMTPAQVTQLNTLQTTTDTACYWVEL